jgi:hypothetical protein
MASYDISFAAVDIPANSGGIAITVEEDATTDGTVDTSEVVALSDGVTTYSTGDVFVGSGQVRVNIEAGAGSDVEVAAAIEAPVEVDPPATGAGSVIKTTNGVVDVSGGVIETV